MEFKQLKNNWEELGKSDPYWAVLSDPAKINNQWDLKQFYQTGINFVQTIDKKFSPLAHIRYGQVLDFGCGPGRITQALAQKSQSAIGVDVSSTMIAEARKHNRFPAKCAYKVNPHVGLPDFASDTFDLVFSYITLQHIEPQYTLQYLTDFIRIAKPGGHILFNLPTQPPFFFRVLKACIGQRGLNWLRRRYYRKSSVIEMHAIPEDEMKQFFDKSNVELVATLPDDRIGMRWQSNFYLLKAT